MVLEKRERITPIDNHNRLTVKESIKDIKFSFDSGRTWICSITTLIYCQVISIFSLPFHRTHNTMNSPRISSPRTQSPSVMRMGVRGFNDANAFAQYGDFFNNYRWRPLDKAKPNTRSSPYAPLAPGGIRSS